MEEVKTNMKELYNLTHKILHNMVLHENPHLIKQYGSIKRTLNTFYIYDNFMYSFDNETIILENNEYKVNIQKNCGNWTCSYRPPVIYSITNLSTNEIIKFSQIFSHSEKIIIDELYNAIYNILSNKKLNGYKCYVD
jgi:hypothetical protein